ncbi:hypothetical protein AB0M94_22300 [Streptomyces xanthochromogenes]|uniref:Uncharacterized protein n=1 Tax=Streptomyces xanthochromogenes TaxID=67384 RepID=A0ABQ3AAR4_9ACTN|nr:MULTISPECIES: hypothetical protein [Streptomyces]MYV93101.1 hypothetical protein [Streptomyces sp. SID1034]GGY38615.1 hypothetical protein GCM10010326_35850 [Streptomyces xanthochromogenes]
MRKFLEAAGFLLLVQGIGGLVHEWTGWFGLWTVVHRPDALQGHEVFASIVLAVAGVAVLVASERVGQK